MSFLLSTFFSLFTSLNFLSMFLGLTYLEHLVNQLHTLILKIQGIYDRYYNSDLSKGLSL